MHSETIPLEETDCFSTLFLDYINQKQELNQFHSGFPSIENFERQIERKTFPRQHRDILVSSLTSQYASINTSNLVADNINSLRNEKTFTVTTGHQLNIFTGPLYFIYKIVTVINACKQLKSQYPDFHFVPVYWMASEDHDFDEINHFYLDGRKFQWNTDQTGAVGRFALEEIKPILDQLPKGVEFFHDAYSKENLAEAVRSYVNYLFGSEGLVVIDADDTALKELFLPVVKDDLFVHSSQKASDRDTQLIRELGYKTQVTAREINFFYLDGSIRERIEKTKDGFVVIDTDLSFTSDEMEQLMNQHPEKFSPNVILRPLYQEMILPNLAYVGGPSEAVYWLQLKSVFEHFNTPFPLLMPRNFALVVKKHIAEKWSKTGLEHKDLFLENQQAFSKWITSNSQHDLSFEGELQEFDRLYEKLKSKAGSVDTTLVQHIDALKSASKGRVDKAEKKLIRAEKRHHEERKSQIDDIKDILFPGGGLQERKDNFLNFYLDNPNFVKELLANFDAFNYSMYLLFD